MGWWPCEACQDVSCNCTGANTDTFDTLDPDWTASANWTLSVSAGKLVVTGTAPLPSNRRAAAVKVHSGTPTEVTLQVDACEVTGGDEWGIGWKDDGTGVEFSWMLKLNRLGDQWEITHNGTKVTDTSVARPSGTGWTKTFTIKLTDIGGGQIQSEFCVDGHRHWTYTDTASFGTDEDYGVCWRAQGPVVNYPMFDNWCMDWLPFEIATPPTLTFSKPTPSLHCHCTGAFQNTGYKVAISGLLGTGPCSINCLSINNASAMYNIDAGVACTRQSDESKCSTTMTITVDRVPTTSTNYKFRVKFRFATSGKTATFESAVRSQSEDCCDAQKVSCPFVSADSGIDCSTFSSATVNVTAFCSTASYDVTPATLTMTPSTPSATLGGCAAQDCLYRCTSSVWTLETDNCVPGCQCGGTGGFPTCDEAAEGNTETSLCIPE